MVASDVWSVLLCSVFFFSSRRRHTRLQGDWSSDVCSSDLFSFLTGLDLDDASGRMTLVRSLESMQSFPSLKAASAAWGTLRARIDGLADTVQKLGQAVGRLQQLCDRSEERRVGKECRSRWS